MSCFNKGIRVRTTFYALAFFVLSSCSNDPAEVLATADKLLPSTERGRDVTIIYSDQGQVKMQLKSDRVFRSMTQNPYMEFIGSVRVVFYDPMLQPTSTLDAQYAIRYEETQLTIIRDSVVVVNEQGEQLNTEELTWDPVQKKIYSDKFVRIRTADEILLGTGFESDQEFKRYRILNPEGTLTIHDDE